MPATNRSAGRSRGRGIRINLTRPRHRPRRRPRPPPSRPSSLRRGLLGRLGGWRLEPAQVAAVVVDAAARRAPRRVAHHGHRGGVHLDPLELVEVCPGGVGQDRLDDVAVRHRHPDRVRAVRLLAPRRPSRAPRPALGTASRRSTRRGTRPRRGSAPRRLVLHDPPQRPPWPARELPPGPRPVAALPETVVAPRPVCRSARLRDARSRGLQAPLQRGGDHDGQTGTSRARRSGQPRASTWAAAVVVEADAAESSRPAIRTSSAASAHDERAGRSARRHVDGPHCVACPAVVSRRCDRRPGHLPRGSPAGLRRPQRRAGPAARSRNGFLWIGLKDPTDDEFALVNEELQLHPLAVEDAVHGRPAGQDRVLRGHDCSWSLKTLRYVEADLATWRPAR